MFRFLNPLFLLLCTIALAQEAMIDTIGIDQLPERLQEIARLRVAYKEVSLKELGEKQ